MTALVKEILVNTVNRTVVKFTHDGSNGVSLGVSTVTGQVAFSDYAYALTGPNYGSTGPLTRVDISKAFWTMTSTSTSPTMAVVWNIPGYPGLTGQPGIFLAQSGMVDYKANGMTITCSLTGASHDNQINIYNVSPIPANAAVTIILDLTKVSGFGPTG